MANEVSPAPDSGGLRARAGHGVLVVLAALAILAAGALLVRAALCRGSGQRQWQLLATVTHGVARIVVRPRRPEHEPLDWSNLCVLRPDGELIQAPSTPYLLDGGSPVSEPGDLEIGFPVLQPGLYELRLYGTRRLYELERWTLDVTSDAITYH